MLLAAVALLLDTPISSLLDAALEALPTVWSLGQGQRGRAPGIVLPPFARTLLLRLLRAVPIALSASFLYLLLASSAVPKMLLRARRGFEAG